MNQDEFDRLSKWIDDELRKRIMDAYKVPPSQFSAYISSWRISSMSPTDKNSKGVYKYQEPEQDEQGTLYGYKVLFCERVEYYDAPNLSLQSRPEEFESLYANPSARKVEFVFRSPRYPVKWNNGQLLADREPSENSMFGIHFTKREDHSALDEYMDDNPWGVKHGMGFLVKCALSGTVVETEQGFRVQHARIIGVKVHGNWESYQDFERRTGFDSRRNSEEERYWGTDFSKW